MDLVKDLIAYLKEMIAKLEKMLEENKQKISLEEENKQRMDRIEADIKKIKA